MPIDDKDMVIAFGPPKEQAGPSSTCLRLAGLLGVPAEKVQDFEHLLDAYLTERDEAKEGDKDKEEGDGDDDEDDGY